MPKWVEFTADHDHTWPSRAVTAFKKGQKVYVKDEVAARAIAKKRANEIEKPEDGDPAHVTTASPLETPADKAYTGKDAAPPQASDRPGTDGVVESDDVDHVGIVIFDAADVPAPERQ